jgi:carboxymethylenebutenolidase
MRVARGWVLVASLVLSACAADEHTSHAEPAAQASAASAPSVFAYPDIEALPPGADRAQASIDRSPRHGEWVSVTNPGGVPIKTWVVYPERADKAPVILVIHTIGGLAPWARALADQLAEDGYIAVAPDFLSGLGANGGGTDAFASPDEVRKAMSAITPADAASRLDRVREYALTIPAANGKVATMGFCWGGSRSFEYALHQPALNAAVVFYGSAPENVAGYGTIDAPILGLYGGDDARVNATIEPAAAALKELGKSFEYEIYEGAGHGFVGSQADRGGANFKATEKAWPRALAFLRKHL